MRAQFEEKRVGLYRYHAPEAEKTTITYVPLEGNVGLISDGAGTGMLTLDLLRDAGLSVASFCELGGMTTPEVMYRAMELTLENHPGIKALIVVLIGGFNRMDNMAAGLTAVSYTHLDVYKRQVHMRNEKDKLLQSIDEMNTVVENSGVRLQISHHKALGYRKMCIRDRYNSNPGPLACN